MRWLRRSFLVAASVVGLLMAGLVIQGLLGIAVPVGALRGYAESAAASALDRRVEIGTLGVVPALPLVVEAGGVAIGRAREGGDLLHVSGLRVHLALLPLLRGEVQIHEIEGEGVRLELVGDAGTPRGAPPTTQRAPAEGGSGELAPFAVGRLALRDVYLQYSAAPGSEPIELRAELLEARAPIGEPLRLTLRGTLRGEPLRLSLEGGSLSDLFQGVGAWPLEGRADWGEFAIHANGSIDPSRAKRCVEVALRSGSVDVGALARLLAVRGSATGNIEGLDLRVGAPCRRGADLPAALELEFRVAGGNVQIAEPEGPGISLAIERIAVSHAEDVGLRASASFALMEEPLAIELEGSNLGTWGAWALRATARGGGARLETTGELGPDPGGLRLEIEANGARIGDLWQWLGVPRVAAAPYRVKGHLQGGPEGWRLDLPRIELGRSRFHGALSLGRGPGGAPLAVDLAAEVLDPSELSAILASGSADVSADAQGLSFDAPIIPGRLVLEDADLNVSVLNFEGAWSEISDLFLALRVRDGMLSGPLGANLGGVAFRGEVQVDATGEVPRAALHFAAKDLDIGTLLARLGLVEGLEAGARSLTAHGRARGNTLAELAETFRLEAEIGEGTWTLDSGTEAETLLRVVRASLSGAPGTPTRLDLDGMLGELPAEIRVETGSLADLARGGETVAVDLAARIPETELELSVRAALPLDWERLDGAFEIRGSRLDALEPLVDFELPPLGPYRARGRLDVDARAYVLSDATFQMGETELEGEASLDTEPTPPRLDARLHALHLQLDDFDFHPEAVSGGIAPEKWASYAAAVSWPETLARLDARVEVTADRVSLGAEPLGAGTLRLALEDGRVTVDPLEIHVGSGDATLTASCQPQTDDLRCNVATRVPRFDYAVLARRLNPTADQKGLFTLDAALTSVAPDAENLLTGASGRLDLAVWPENLGAGALDIFSVNLLQAVLPLLGIAESSVNCLVARMDLDEGVMRPETLLIDTTDTRVHGEGTIDFRSERIDLVLRPIAKRSRLLSLETPLMVRGNLADFGADIPPESIADTVFHFTTSVVAAPMQWLFGKPPPADGSDVCVDPLAR